MTATYANKSAVFCAFLWVAFVATAFAADLEGSPDGGVVRQVDHVVIRVDTVADAQALWLLFSEKLKLPVAWPPADYGQFFSGGVSVGNVNLEFAYLNSLWLKSHWTPQFHTRAQFFGFGLEPVPLSQALQELDQRALRHDQPEPYRIKGRDGNPRTLWTEVPLTDLSRHMSVFLIEYDPGIWQTPDHPHQTMEDTRGSLREQLQQRDGGPAGIRSAKEILIGTSHYNETLRQWDSLLNSGNREFRGYWQPAAGPAVRFVSARTEGIRSLIIRVAELGRARTFLQTNGLLGRSNEKSLLLDQGTMLGIDVRFVE
jgi:hypothetical protein